MGFSGLHFSLFLSQYHPIYKHIKSDPSGEKEVRIERKRRNSPLGQVFPCGHLPGLEGGVFG